MVKVYIRVDGNLAVGMGHLIRCIALAQMIAGNFKVYFACRDIPAKTVSVLAQLDFELLMLTEEHSFWNLLSKNDIAILDGYNFGLDYQQKVKATGASVICIDDMADQTFAVDGIINHAPGITPERYYAPPTAQFALGPQYALLRPSFLAQARRKRFVTKNETLFICFGGGDFKDLTRQTLQTVLAANRFKKITVVTGPAYSFSETLAPLISNSPLVKHYHSISEEDMLLNMMDADVAIVPASGIVYEALCAGCKIISGTYVENQQQIFNALAQQGALISAGSFSEKEILQALHQLDTFAPINYNIIDGFSPKRINAFLHQVKLAVRPATGDDCKRLFEWANDSDVRCNAINKEPIQWDGHVKWFASKMQGNNSKIFILEYNGHPVAQVRYDLDDTAWVIDYSVDKNYRGKGFGKTIIEKTLHHFAGKEVKALVLKENIASSATFEKLHFAPAGDIMVHGQTFLVFKYLQ